MPDAYLINKATGERDLVDDVDAALASGKYLTPSAIAVHSGGDDVYATPEQRAQGGKLVTPIDSAAVEARHGEEARAQANKGLANLGKATLGAAADTASFGIVNPWQEQQEFNPLGRIAGVGVGLGASLLVPGGPEAELLAEPAAAERIAGGLSSKFLHAGEVGAERGAARELESTMLRGKGARLSNEIREGMATPARPLAEMTAPELEEARTAELENIQAARSEETKQIIQDLAKHREQKLTDAVHLATSEEDAKAIGSVSEAAAMQRKADETIRNMLNNPKALERNPGRIMDALTAQENALNQIAKDEPQLRELFQADASGKRVAALDALPETLKRNQALQERVAVILDKPTSPALDAIKGAQDALKGPKAAEGEGGIVGQLLGGKVFHSLEEGIKEHLGLGGGIGSVIAAKGTELIKHLVLGGGGKVVAEGAAKGAAAVGKFLAAKAPTALPVIATQVLANTRFAPSQGEAKGSGKEPLADLYAKRSAEIRSQTAFNALGVPQMRPEARTAMAQNFAPLRMAAPKLADQVETVAARKIEFLSSKLPRRPDVAGIPIGPDTWKPSDMQIRTFARYVDAVEHPDAVINRLAAGVVSPEDAEVMRTVYPEMLQGITNQVIEQLPTLATSLPYSHRLAFATLTGVPVDPAMRPEILGSLQSSFADEPGTQGGTQAPKAQPAFGSIKKSLPEPTPAQERAG